MKTFIMDDGVRLHATLEKPEEIEKCPLVIVFHGFTGHSEEVHIKAVADILRSLGCATLRVDLYGHGCSDGRFHDHTLYKWLNNAMAVIDYARTLPFVTDLYLCGHSQGGLTVMLAAALKHELIRGIIPMSPAAVIPEGARKGELLGMRFDPDRIPDEIPVKDGLTLGGNYIRVAQTIHVEEAIARYKGPVCLVHGTADEAIPAACSVEAQKAYADAQLFLIPGDTHCYDYHLDQALEAVRRWMAGQLAAG